MSLSLDSMVVATSDHAATDLADELVILNLKNGTYYGLNPVGASVWKLIQQPHRVRAICESVMQTYDVEQTRCQADVLELLHALSTHGLITWR